MCHVPREGAGSQHRQSCAAGSVACLKAALHGTAPRAGSLGPAAQMLLCQEPGTRSDGSALRPRSFGQYKAALRAAVSNSNSIHAKQHMLC